MSFAVHSTQQKGDVQSCGNTCSDQYKAALIKG